jgi:glycosyltransferase involved in cell wall biosynthesis
MSVVFIPTRNRVELVERVLPKWQQQDVDEIVLMVERQERSEYRRIAKRYKNVSTFQLPESNRGINYSRNQIVEAAYSMGCDRIIMSDDDIYPRPDSDVNRLYEWKGLNTIGIGIMVPFYGLMFGNQTIKEQDRPLMSKGALGKRCFSLNVKRAIAIGNFDVRPALGLGR